MITLNEKELDFPIEDVKLCPVCGSSDIDPYASNKYRFPRGGEIPLTLFLCKSCSHIYISPRPTAEAYIEIYSSPAYRYLVRSIAEDSGEPTLYDFSAAAIGVTRQTDQLLELLTKQVIYATKIVDVGGATGLFLLMLHEKMKSVDLTPPKMVNVELNEQWAKWGRPYGIVDVRTMKEAKEHGPYDLVTCIHTLEHMTEPIEFLKELVSLGAEGATYYIEVPSIESPERSLSFFHPQVFTKDSFEFATKCAGLEPLLYKYTAYNTRVVDMYMIAKRK